MNQLLFPFGPYVVVAITALMFTVPAFGYLVWLHLRLSANIALLCAFFFIMLSLVTMAIGNLYPYHLQPFVPLQDVFVIATAYFLVRFLYYFPHNNRPVEARYVIWFFGIVALFALGWFCVMGWQHFILHQYQNRNPLLFQLLMPIINLLAILVSFRRMVHFAPNWGVDSGIRAWGRLFYKPPNRMVRAFRNFGLAILSGLVQAGGSILAWFGLSYLVAGEALIIIGTLLFLPIFILVYLNAAAIRTTFIVRLVGAALVLSLMIFGLVSTQILRLAREDHAARRGEIGPVVLAALANDAPLVQYPLDVQYVIGYAADVEPAARSADYVYLATWSPATVSQLMTEIRQPVVSDEGSSVINRFAPVPLGTRATIQAYTTQTGNTIYEVGFNIWKSPVSHKLTVSLLQQLFLGSAVLLIVLPIFYQLSLVRPLQRLMDGIQRVMRGDIAVHVPTQNEDEIGYLTNAFNQMTDSLRVLNEELEQKVRDRTVALEAEITGREAVQHELEIAIEQAEAANHAKSVFLANMSHELRTPLNAILGYAQILRQQQAQAEIAKIIQRSGNHLLTLINDVLDIAKIEAGKMELTAHPLHLQSILEEMVDTFRLEAHAKSLRFAFESVNEAFEPSDSADDLYILADGKRLRQVLTNLLGNAIKFTSRGFVRLYVRTTRHDPDSVRVLFRVEDSGIGIDAAEIPLIFQPFYQTVDGARSSGTGLGLAISHQFVEMMGGQLTVISERGQGSQFSFELDFPNATPSVAKTSPARDLIGFRGETPTLLLIDDNRDNLLLLAAMLEPIGFDIELVTDSRTGYSVAKRIAPAAIITDLVMPHVTGQQLIATLRADPAMADTVIIATSANVGQGDSVDADYFLPKPMTLSRLYEVLEEALPLNWIYAPQQSAEYPPLATMQRLLQAANSGDIVTLEAATAGLPDTPFATQLRQYVTSFQISKLCQWLTTLIDEVQHDATPKRNDSLS